MPTSQPDVHLPLPTCCCNGPPQAHALCKDDPRNNGTAGRVFGRGPLPADVLPIGTQFNCRYEAKALGVCLNHMTGIEVVEEDGVKVALSLFASEAVVAAGGAYHSGLWVLTAHCAVPAA